MRRFTRSLLARLISRTLIIAMVSMSAQVLVMTKARAQVGPQANWAIVDIVNKSNYDGAATAAVATDAVTRELSKNPKYALVPKTSVDQQMKELGFRVPLRQLEYMKLGQELGAESVVAGSIESVKISKNPPRARVVMSLYVYDVASGFPITGASNVVGESTARPGMTGGEDALVQEAIQYAAFTCVNTVSSLHIPDATVSFAEPTRVILNRGSRDGLKVGMEMLVRRYRDYVARIRITEVSGDDAQAEVRASSKGVRPGDSARAIFPVENYNAKTGAISGPRGKNSIGAVIGAALVIGLIVLFLKGPANTPTDEVLSEPVYDAAQGAAVRISWNTNLFSKGNWNRYEWHIWRQDVVNNPIGVLPGTDHVFVDDTSTANQVVWHDYRDNPGGTLCSTLTSGASIARTAVVVGSTYNYKVDLVYRLHGFEVPGNSGTDDCYFESGTVNSRGQATVVNPPTLEEPSNDNKGVDVRTVNFRWDSVAGANDYIVEVSPDINFRDDTAVVYQSPTTVSGIVSTGTLDISGLIKNIKFWRAPVWYWRVGSRNSGDNPGPVPDAHGYRYVFSSGPAGSPTGPWQFTPVGIPPPPPK